MCLFGSCVHVCTCVVRRSSTFGALTQSKWGRASFTLWTNDHCLSESTEARGTANVNDCHWQYTAFKWNISLQTFSFYFLFCFVFILMVVLMTELLIQPKAVDFAFNMTNEKKKQWSVEFVKQSTWYWTLQGVISLLTVPGNCLAIFLILTRRYLLFFICQQTGISCNNVILLWLSCYFYQQYMHDGIW